MIEGRAFRDEENYVTLVASLTAANARKPAAGSQETAVDVQKIVRTARSLVPAATEARSTRNDVLWVDDHPENNVYERKAFETLGITVSIALSTEQALKLIQSESFGAIISDMGRKEGPKEGYKLLDNLRKQKDKTPFFIYAGSNAQAHKREAAKHGAQGSTNDPNELLQMVTTTILGNYAPPYRG
jgi:CheY-like chemotaxis protein